MKRKPLYPIPRSELEAFSTRQLIARLKWLHQCEESLALSDKDVPDDSGIIEFKQSEGWILAYRVVKHVLNHREYVPKD